MKISYNEVVETLAPAIADKLNLRVVLDMEGHETILIDFSSCGEPFKDSSVVCLWSHQRASFKDGEWTGSDEIDYGSFTSYTEVFGYFFAMANLHGPEFYVETF